MHTSKLSVYVTIPLNPKDPEIHCDVVQTSWRILFDKRFEVTINTPKEMPLENNLHGICKHILKNNFDFWLSIDSDNPPFCNPLDLCFLDLDVVGFPTPIYKWKPALAGNRPIIWNAFDYIEEKDAYVEHKNKCGLQLVDAIGGGCMLVARRVLEHSVMQYQPFARKSDLDGLYNRGNDIAFCERAKDAGFNIWSHFSYQCDHFRKLSLAGIHNGYCAAFNARNN